MMRWYDDDEYDDGDENDSDDGDNYDDIGDNSWAFLPIVASHIHIPFIDVYFRYMKSLEQKDLSLNWSMISLG